MALQRLTNRNLVRMLAVSLAIAMVATVGLVALPAGRANFTGAGVTVLNSKYWGGTTFVPGEVMTIVVSADAGDSITLTFQDTSGTPTSSMSGIIIPSVGYKYVNWTVLPTWPDANSYEVLGHDATSATDAAPVGFSIVQYNQAVLTDRRSYVPGDNVTFTWIVVYEQNYTPAPDGIGAFQVHDNTGLSLLTTPQVTFNVSQSSAVFRIPTTEGVPATGTVEFWFNDTAGLRFVHAFATFRIGTLGIAVSGLQGFPYAPGQIVTATITTRVTGVGPGANPEPNIPVDINVTDLGTALLVPAYSASGLRTDASGVLTYSFVLGMTPQTADYSLTASGNAYGVQSATDTAPFSVRPSPVLSVTVTLDKLDYRSGDTVKATATVVTTETLPLTYSWIVTDTTGRILAAQFGGASVYTYTIAPNYVTPPGGFLRFIVEVNDGNGTLASGSADTMVAFGYLNVNLNEMLFNPGDTVTATYSLSSNVMTSPTYLLEITDATGTTVQSGPTSGGSASYVIPQTPAASYTFTVVATQGGMTVEGSAIANQVGGYFLTVTPDRSNYVPGDTITLSYTVTARGMSALPSQYTFYVSLAGSAVQLVHAASPSGTLTLAVPSNAPTGNLLVTVVELNTGAYYQGTVHVGAINPLLTDVAGVPLFDILIFLLFVVLLLAVILLWRRTGMGRAPRAAETGKPSTPPPPPPSGPSQQAAGPMSVACKHCGASIEITTSKRPIEVMCPSCGETQVVQ